MPREDSDFIQFQNHEFIKDFNQEEEKEHPTMNLDFKESNIYSTNSIKNKEI